MAEDSEVQIPSNWVIDPDFDPTNQTFTLVGPDGETVLPGYVNNILTLQYIATQQGIIFGIQTGATALLIIVLLLMTKSDKRRSAVFMLNLTALLFCFIRSILQASNLHGIFYNYYNWQLHYFPDGTELYRSQDLSATGEIFNCLINAAIYGSLVMQIWIVCCNIARWYKIVLMGVSIVLGLLAEAVRIYLAVFNIKYAVYGVRTLTTDQNDFITHLASVHNIVATLAIAFFSCVFLAKLALAIYNRRKLNMKQFGPMQIIFVMGCQTLFLPRKLHPFSLSSNSAADKPQSSLPP